MQCACQLYLTCWFVFYPGSVPQYEKQAWQAEESGTAQPSLVQLTPLPEHITTAHPRSPSEGVMSWLNDDATSQHSDLSAAHDPSVSDAAAHMPISPNGYAYVLEMPSECNLCIVHERRCFLCAWQENSLTSASCHAVALTKT